MPRYIDADKLNEILVSGFIDEGDALVESPSECNSMLVWAIQEAKGMPTADVVEVVRCKDCKWWKTNYYWNGQECKVCVKEAYTPIRTQDDFCSYGERREDEN